MKRLGSILICLISLLSIQALATSSHRIICPKDRKGDTMCPMYVDPVCAVPYADQVQCIKAPCVFQKSNDCVACSDLNVDYFIKGKCSQIDFNVQYCQEKERGAQFCPQNYTETCGYQSDGSVFSFYSNRCFACANKEVDYIKFEKCPPKTPPKVPEQKQKIYCTQSERNAEVCTMEYIETCGYTMNGESFKSFGNRCSACANPEISFIVFSACPASSPDQPVHHDVDDGVSQSSPPAQPCTEKQKKAVGCTKELIWHCGIKSNGQGSDNYSNRCMACKDPQVQLVYLGQCKKAVDLPINNGKDTVASLKVCSAEEQKAEFCAEIYMPVCGYSTSGSMKPKNFSNRCEACQTPQVTEAADVECEQVNSNPKFEKCPDHRFAKCSTQKIPVCANLIDCSNDPQCQQTYTNMCIACTDTNVMGTTPGECVDNLMDQARMNQVNAAATGFLISFFPVLLLIISFF